jgi:hypothetical protein
MVSSYRDIMPVSSNWNYLLLLDLLRRSQWQFSLRRGSAATRLLGLRVGIQPRAWMSLVGTRFWQVEVSAAGWSLVQGSPTECRGSECDREASILRMLWSTRAVEPLQQEEDLRQKKL